LSNSNLPETHPLTPANHNHYKIVDKLIIAYYNDMALNIFVSKIQDGSMKPIHSGDIEHTNRARTNFLLKNGINPNDTTLVRVKYEGDNYKRYFTVDNSHKGDGVIRESTLTSDAIVVSEYNHALFLPLADCIGAVLHDPIKNILMVSHLGRHNLEQFGGTASVEHLIKYHDIDTKNLKVWLSPAAGKESYPLFAFNNRSLHEVAFEQFTGVGVLPENIEASSIDSAKNEEYYSHSQFLKGNRTSDGRFAIVACMTK
jgi:hypothetical protein